jgi:hypothetical protein
MEQEYTRADRQKDDLDQDLMELKDLVELYGITPEHLKETLATVIVSWANSVRNIIGPYNRNPSDDNIKASKVLLNEVEKILPGRVDKE